MLFGGVLCVVGCCLVFVDRCLLIFVLVRCVLVISCCSVVVVYWLLVVFRLVSRIGCYSLFFVDVC